ncbi:MAG: TonB-dependent siderophore receptor [Marinomonas sp.]
MKSSLPIQPTLLALAIASASSHSFAAESPNTNTSAGNAVNTEEEATLSGDQLSPLVVKGQTYRNTATKTQLDSKETPQGISVIEQGILKERGTESVAESVRYTAGVNTELRGGAVTRLDLFNIRGFQNYQNYYDGLQLLYNDWNLQPQIDMAAVEQVEVFKGPTSTLYGSMPPGGMVNMISKSPQKESKSSVEVTLGNDEKHEIQIDSTGPLTDNINYRVIGLFREKDGQAVTTEEERYMIAPSIDWKISDNTLLNINMYYQKDPSMGAYTSLPSEGTVYSNVNGSLDTDAFSGDANWNTYSREEFLLGYKIDHTINDTWSFLQNARFMDATAYQENTYTTGLSNDGTTVSRHAYLTDEESQGITIDNQFSGVFDLGNTEHNFLVGMDYLKLKSDIIYEDAVAPSLNLYDPDYYQISYSNLDFSASGYSSDFTIDKEQTGLYFQDQMRINQWVLIAGGRYDKYYSTTKGVQYSSDVNTNVDQSQFSGRLGVLYEMENGFSPFISYAQSFEPVSGADSDGNAYDTSTANQWEAGIKYDSGRTKGSLTAYQILKENVLTQDPDSDSSYNQIQVGEVRSRGIELEVQQQLTKSINWRIAYTLQNVVVTEDNSGLKGTTPIWVPDQQLSTWLSYVPQDGKLLGSTFGAGVRYVGEMELNAENTGTVPSYSLVDLSIGYDLSMLGAKWNGASVQFSMSNALNKTYYSCYDEDNCWYGDSRSFEVTGRYEF